MVTFDHVGTFPDGELSKLRESERVSVAVRRDIARLETVKAQKKA